MDRPVRFSISVSDGVRGARDARSGSKPPSPRRTAMSPCPVGLSWSSAPRLSGPPRCTAP